MSNDAFTIRWLGFSYLRGRKVSKALLTVLALQDWLLRLTLGRERRAPVPPLEKKRIVVAKIDHLGDVLMTTPLLQELRRQVPSATIDLVLGSWCREIGELLRENGLCDRIVYYDAAPLNKGRASRFAKLARALATFRETVRFLRGADLFLDLRPFSPNTLLAARLARVPHKVGFGLRGCAFFLQQELDYDPHRPLGQLFLDALPTLGLQGGTYRKPEIPVRGAPPREAGGIPLPENYMVVHPFSREKARMIQDDLWPGLIAKLAAGVPVVVLGSPEDQTSHLATLLATAPNVVPLIGRTSFREAMEVLRGADGFVGVDSVFSHVALAFNRPTLVLLRKGTGLKASFPDGNPRLLFADPEGTGVDGASLARAFAAHVTTPIPV